jgi:hypothetical protein
MDTENVRLLSEDQKPEIRQEGNPLGVVSFRFMPFGHVDHRQWHCAWGTLVPLARLGKDSQIDEPSLRLVITCALSRTLH